MTKIKLCGMFREEDIAVVNEVKPDYCGFIVNFPKSHRSISFEKLQELRKNLDNSIKAVGVFVDEPIETIENLLNDETIDLAQLHGNETDETIRKIQSDTGKPVIKAYRIRAVENSAAETDSEPIRNENENHGIDEVVLAKIRQAENSPADYILLDAGQGDGKPFDWTLLKQAVETNELTRPYFLAGGLNTENLQTALDTLHPFAVDLSSGIETDKVKDKTKMQKVMQLIRS